MKLDNDFIIVIKVHNSLRSSNLLSLIKYLYKQTPKQVIECIEDIMDHQSLRSLAEDLYENLTIPRTVGDAKLIGSSILKYKDSNYYSVFGAYILAYIILQSLCIPGSVVLSILAGYLFPAPLALLIICTCSTIGATNAYFLSSLLFTKLTDRLEIVKKFRNYINRYKSNLFMSVFLLRATPIFPNWTINLCSPLVKIPLKPFILGTFLGVAPLSVVHVWTGRILNDLSNDQSLINWQSVLLTSVLAISIALLVYVRNSVSKR